MSRGYVLPLPCRTLVRDLFIPNDLFVGAIPEVNFQLQNPAGVRESRREGLLARLVSLDLVAPIEQLRPGSRGVAISGLPRHAEAVAEVFRAIGEDPARFRGYRCRIAYPVPLVEMLWGLRLEVRS
jgi:hypothetical protein